MIDCESLGQLIREKRKEKGFTQRELADLINVTDKSVSKWECGKCYPDISLWEKLFLVLDISKDSLDLVDYPSHNNQSIEEPLKHYFLLVKATKILIIVGIIALFSLATVFRYVFIIKRKVIFFCSTFYFGLLAVALYFTNRNIKKSKEKK